MRKASEILDNFFDFYHLHEGKQYVGLFRGWRDIVGEDIASHSNVIDIRNNIIVVGVDHPGWMQLIQFQEKEFIRKIRKQFPELNIKSLNLRLLTGKKENIENYNRNEHTDSKKMNEDKENKNESIGVFKDKELYSTLLKLKEDIETFWKGEKS